MSDVIRVGDVVRVPTKTRNVLRWLGTVKEVVGPIVRVEINGARTGKRTVTGRRVVEYMAEDCERIRSCPADHLPRE